MELKNQYYPDFTAVSVEGWWLSQAKKYLELQKELATNKSEAQIITISTDNNNEKCSVNIKNLVGNFSESGKISIYEPMTHSFTPGTGPWPFGESTPIEALINVGIFLHQQELETDKNEKSLKIFDFQISSSSDLGFNSFDLSLSATDLPLKLTLNDEIEVCTVDPWLSGSI